MNYDSEFIKACEPILGSVDCLKIDVQCKSFLWGWYLKESIEGESIMEFIRRTRKRLLPELNYKATGKYKRSEDRQRERHIVSTLSH